MSTKVKLLERGTAALAPLVLGTGCLWLASCNSSDYSMGQTEYLDGLARPAHQPVSTHLALVDTVSYWEGDGVPGDPKIRINLGEQKAFFYRGDTVVGVARVSTGREGYGTPPGTFKVTQKVVDHRSSAYGNFVDASGNVVVPDVDSRVDKPPPGAKFLGASMPHFMRFNHGVGMHAGYLPGYPDSHGCVRLPDWMAKKFFENSTHGTPVIVEY
ncbi:MAG TPA: L,D-transpeptidase family protein [Verrucomicrobiales bacterium]|nr:L,D-transpeptidase family protein [Verrucomicrobiales bacterium]